VNTAWVRLHTGREKREERRGKEENGRTGGKRERHQDPTRMDQGPERMESGWERGRAVALGFPQVQPAAGGGSFLEKEAR
jgi:hypothetical protein